MVPGDIRRFLEISKKEAACLAQKCESGKAVMPCLAWPIFSNFQYKASCKLGRGPNQPSWSVLMHWTPPNSLHISNSELQSVCFLHSAAVFQVMQGNPGKTSLLPTWHSTILTWLDIDGKRNKWKVLYIKITAICVSLQVTHGFKLAYLRGLLSLAWFHNEGYFMHVSNFLLSLPLHNISSAPA